MLLDIKKIFGTYDEPVTAALELDLSRRFPGIYSAGHGGGAHHCNAPGADA